MLRSVFGKTIWERRLSILWWALGTAAMSALLVAFYPTLRDNPAIEEFLSQFPEEFLATFGIDPALYTTGYGFLQGQLYSFMAPVIVIALAIGLGASATAAEEEAGTLDQLLSLPLSRGRLVAEKLLAMVVLVVVVLVALAAVLVGGNAVVGLGLSPRGIVGINLGLLLLGLFFGTFAAAIGAWRGRTALAQGLAIALAAGSFFTHSFAPLVEGLAGLEKLTPFYWFLQGNPLLDGPSPSFFILATGSGLFGVMAGVLFRHRDVRAQAPVVSLPGVPFVVGGRSRRPSRLLRSIYGETTWQRRKSVWAWLGGLALLSGVVMAFYPAIVAGGEQDAFQALLDAVPEELLALFGITEPESLLTAAGFISSRVYSSIGLLLMISFAVGIGRSALAGEEEKGTADLLVSMPMSRRRIVTERFLAMVTLVGFLCVGLSVVIGVGNQIFRLELGGEAVLAANLGIGLIALVFGSLALAVGALSGRPGVSAAVAGGAAVATFFLNGLAAAVDSLAPLRPFSPFYWYLGESTPLAAGFSVTFGLLAALTIAFFMGAVALFERRNVGT